MRKRRAIPNALFWTEALLLWAIEATVFGEAISIHHHGFQRIIIFASIHRDSISIYQEETLSPPSITPWTSWLPCDWERL